MADADERRRQALMAVLAADPGFELVTPAAAVQEIHTTAGGADVVVLIGHLDGGHSCVDVLRSARHGPHPAWVVLIDDASVTDDVLAAGAEGCLAVSSTPVQIGAAIQAAARGEHAGADQSATGPLVQRTRRSTPPLTERETEVLLLVDAGLANKEIADRLYLSLSSVKSHLSHTYGRLGVKRREAAVAEARRQGLL